MEYNNKAELVEELRKAMEDDRPLNAGECMDGRYIDERIAFEMYSDEEKERLRKKYANIDADIEKQRKKILRDKAAEVKLQEVLRNRQQAKARREE